MREPELAQTNPDTQFKILSLQELVVQVGDWRRGQKRIVFTNGCFDLLHVGHIVLFEHCRRFGDKVIVGINTDRSVRKLKGPSRPLVSEQQRARVLAALTAIDAVVIFDQTTPLELVLTLRPDVLVKGGDYSESTIVGAREVRSWGGNVEIVPIVEGFSTTQIVNKVMHESILDAVPDLRKQKNPKDLGSSGE